MNTIGPEKHGLRSSILSASVCEGRLANLVVVCWTATYGVFEYHTQYYTHSQEFTKVLHCVLNKAVV